MNVGVGVEVRGNAEHRTHGPLLTHGLCGGVNIDAEKARTRNERYQNDSPDYRGYLHLKGDDAWSGLTISNSAASEASPLQ
jgi:hypothetical protein